jgi:hypothetical protein
MLLVGIFAINACNACNPPQSTDPILNGHTIMDWVNYDSNPGSPSDIKPLDDLILYLDSSLSMQGYADPGGQFEYAVALRAIQSVVDRLEPRHAILFRRVDRHVGPLDANPKTLFAASTDRRFYQRETSNSSNLAGAIRSFDVPEADLEEGRGIARCHILVTDGVQHTNASSPETDCVQGSDARCVNMAISRLIGKGWGVHLFGVRSRFRGPIFSENLGRWMPGEYIAATPRNPSRYRPFLIYLFTNEEQYLGHLVERFRRELLSSGINPELIMELPLSLPLVETSKLQLDTQAYNAANAFNPKKPYPNPLVLRTDATSREDSDGVTLPDSVQVFWYRYKKIDSLKHFAVHLSTSARFTSAGKALFGRDEADVGSLLKPLSVQLVKRPPEWFGPAPAEVAKEEPLQGFGRSSDAAGGQGRNQKEPPKKVQAGSETLRVWPPLPHQMKHLNFQPNLLKDVPDSVTIKGKEPTCSLNGGCHLVMNWGRPGDVLPIVLLRVEGKIDMDQIRLPGWITEWSTPTDSSLDHANRILNLDRQVQGLLQNDHVARQGLGPWYLLIRPKVQN